MFLRAKRTSTKSCSAGSYQGCQNQVAISPNEHTIKKIPNPTSIGLELPYMTPAPTIGKIRIASARRSFLNPCMSRRTHSTNRTLTSARKAARDRFLHHHDVPVARRCDR